MKGIKIHQIGIKRHAAKLEHKGFSEAQIDSVLEFIQDVLSQHTNDIARKSDIKLLKEKIEKVEMRLVIKLGGIISFWASVLLTLMKV